VETGERVSLKRRRRTRRRKRRKRRRKRAGRREGEGGGRGRGRGEGEKGEEERRERRERGGSGESGERGEGGRGGAQELSSSDGFFGRSLGARPSSAGSARQPRTQRRAWYQVSPASKAWDEVSVQHCVTQTRKC